MQCEIQPSGSKSFWIAPGYYKEIEKASFLCYESEIIEFNNDPYITELMSYTENTSTCTPVPVITEDIVQLYFCIVIVVILTQRRTSNLSSNLLLIRKKNNSVDSKYLWGTSAAKFKFSSVRI